MAHGSRRLKVLGVLLVVALVSGPTVAWWMRPRLTLAVQILDKTVPDPSFREHRGLVWLLNHLRLDRPDGRPYDFREDYHGFRPLERWQWRIQEKALDQPVQLFYVADTYGVYEEEFYGRNLGNRSRKLYGGLELKEVEAMKRAVAHGGLLVAEFNAFASPTGGAARRAFSEWMGIRWSGWIGRYFPDLTPGEEVPPWAVSNYVRQYQRPWLFRGAGFLFVDEADHVVVLEEGREAEPGACRLAFNDAAVTRFGVAGSYRYNYWFDILESEDDTSVLARYQLNLTPAGQQRLADWKIPLGFPAVLTRDAGKARLYYFAGDFVDVPKLPRVHRIRGLLPLQSFFSREGSVQNDRFFWRAYVPMMESILAEAQNRPGR